MGMGSIPCHAYTISLDNLRAFCPDEVAECETLFGPAGETWDTFARSAEFDEYSEAAPIMVAWKALQAAFARMSQTTVSSHLELGIGYYSEDDGDRYDDLEPGVYFSVDGMTQLTPAGKQFKDVVKEQSWTVYG